MANAIWKNRVSRFLVPFTRLGLIWAVFVFVTDQFSKWWILVQLNLDQRPPLQITPFLDLAMAWNKGVSYSLLETSMQGMLIALSLGITGYLLHLLSSAQSQMAAISYGLVIGGALGNALDRALHGAVADFMHLQWGRWSWYIFNIADIGIVAGVAILIYDGFFGRPKI
jgi:signal peptidase II